MAADVRLLVEPFDPAAELAAFSAAQPAAGGIVSFLGQVRCGGGVEALELRHYGPLTLPGMEALAAPLRRVVERVCLHEEGLEALERAQGWPARSGKLALKLGLAQLAIGVLSR